MLAEEVVSLGQEPVRRLPGIEHRRPSARRLRGTPKLFTRFLGFFGPQGALPLATTVEAYNWVHSTRPDISFPRFVDIFANRFLQLFFRAWADARPIAQSRPARATIASSRYVGSFAGIGTERHREPRRRPGHRQAPLCRPRLAAGQERAPAARS